MTISLKHTTQVNTSTYPDDGTSPVGSNEWNEEHTLTLATARLLGRTTASTGAVEEISVGDGLTLSAGSLSANIGRVTNGDSNYTITTSDRVVVTSATLTAPRTWTLPAANGVPAGTRIRVLDVAGGVTATNTLSIARAGTDTIEGGTASIVINGAREGIELTSDGSSKWTTTWMKTGPNSQVFTASGTYTPSAGARSAFFQVQAGGGSGGGSAGSASNAGFGSGGGAGGYSERMQELAVLSTAVTVTVGAGGAAPTAGNNAGNAGSLSSVAATGMTTVSAPAGSAGGASGAAGTSILGVAGGAETSAPTGGDLNVPGGAGFGSYRLSGTSGFAGQGASSFFGGGGRAAAGATSAGGGAAGVYGAGGAGASSTGATNSAGGAGKAGVVIVTEFF